VPGPYAVSRWTAKLKGIRERRRLTQEQLADKSGVSRSYLARLETCRQDPTLRTLEKLARALGVEVGEVAGVMLAGGPGHREERGKLHERE
jgi:transcriptional regulator with XRE-family HTH domain